MATTFSSWASGESTPADSWNGDQPRDDRATHDAGPPPVFPNNPPIEQLRQQVVDEMRDELAVARRRLQYFEGFAPWIEEQMAAVVDRAAEVGAESEREQERLAEDNERRRAEVERLTEERDRLRAEAKAIVAEANATAGRVIDEANARAARLLAEAHQNAEGIVNRLRDEAVSIVSRALGDLTSLEARSASVAQPGAAAPLVERGNEDGDEASEARAEPTSVAAGQEPLESSEPDTVSAEPDETADAPASDAGATSWAVEDGQSAGDDAAAAATAEDPGSAPKSEPAAPASTPKEAVAEPDDEPGPFQWLRSALAGRDVSPRNGASNTANGVPYAPPDSAEPAAGAEADSADVFITRLIIHPAFTPEERHKLQRGIEGLPGVERVGPGAVDDDFFELLVTHQLFTSVLGSLLTTAGEHIRLIAQHDDSLEVEVTGLNWVRGEQGSEASRGLDA